MPKADVIIGWSGAAEAIPGSVLHTCALCGRDVWLAPSGQRVKAEGAAVWCVLCAIRETGPDGDGVLRFEEYIADAELSGIESMAIRHFLRLVSYDRMMIEIEFLDQPNPLERFIRFGTDSGRHGAAHTFYNAGGQLSN